MCHNNKWAAILLDADNAWHYLNESFVTNGHKFFLHSQNYQDRVADIKELMDILIKYNLKESMSKKADNDFLLDIYK